MIITIPAKFRTPDDPGLSQYPQMVRNRRLRDSQSLGELRHIVPLLAILIQRQLPENPQTDLIAYRPKLNRQFLKIVH